MMFYQELSDSEKVTVRRWGRRLLALVTLFVLVLILSYGLTVWRDAKILIGGEKLHITLAGEGKVSAKPDVAKISAAIVTQKEFLKEAQDENSKKSNVLIGYVKSEGVEEKDIKTAGYNIYPQYSYPRPCPDYSLCPLSEQRPKIIGYQVRNSVEITIRDITKAGDILAGVVGAGANEVSGITFTIDQPDALRAQARKKAVQDARAKADALARVLGKRVSDIVNFSESGTFPPPIFFAREAALGKGGGDAAPSPSVQPGENEIVVNVSMTYEFK